MGSILERLFRLQAKDGGPDVEPKDGTTSSAEMSRRCERTEGHTLSIEGTTIAAPSCSPQQKFDDGEDVSQLKPLDLYNASCRIHVKLHRSRHSSRNTHAEVQFALQRYCQLQASARKSQQEFMRLMHDAQADREWEQYSSRLFESNERLKADFAALEAQIATLKTCLGRLAVLEYNMRDIEDNMYVTLDSLVRELGIIDHSQYKSMADINNSTQSTASSTLEPLLEDYYDKAGDVNLLRDRLSTLDIEHQELRVSRRDARLDQDRSRSLSESRFERVYLKTRETLSREFQTALREARSARKACEEAGLQPEDSQICTSEPDFHRPLLVLKDGGELEDVSARSENDRDDVNDTSGIQSNLTEHLLRRQGTSSEGPYRRVRMASHAGHIRKTLEIEGWARRLGGSLSEPLVIPTQGQVQEMHNFRGDPKASFEPVLPPRRHSTFTGHQPASLAAFSSEKSSEIVGIQNRRSMSLTRERWDLAEVRRPKSVERRD